MPQPKGESGKWKWMWMWKLKCEERQETKAETRNQKAGESRKQPLIYDGIHKSFQPKLAV